MLHVWIGISPRSTSAGCAAPVDDPMIADFVAGLDPINALADSAPGFVWRLQTEDGNATAIRPVTDDGLIAINLSVWESVEALAEFVYRSDHVWVLRRRREWFERFSGRLPRLVVGTCRHDPDGGRRHGAARPSRATRFDTDGVHVQTALRSTRGRQLDVQADDRDVCPA